MWSIFLNTGMYRTAKKYSKYSKCYTNWCQQLADIKQTLLKETENPPYSRLDSPHKDIRLPADTSDGLREFCLQDASVLQNKLQH